jgi:DNA polymerase-3 subunit delta'
MSLKNVFCQEKAINAIQLAFAGDKVAHAYIFAGPDGVGKSTTAREFAKLLLCKNPIFTAENAKTAEKKNEINSACSAVKNGFADSCGDCESCRLFEAGSHPDFEHIYKELLEYTREGKDKDPPVQFPIDVVREFLIEKISSKPALSARRVFILTEAEKLNNESQNCLLKVLEEPPAYCCIILICTRPDKLLPTIRSRCQILRFGPVAEEKIIEKLNELGLDEQQAKFFARFAAGSLGLACIYARLEKSEANLYQAKKELLNDFAELEYKGSLELAEKLQQQSRSLASVWTKLEPGISKTDINRKAIKTIIQILISALNDVMLANINPEKTPVNFDQPEQISKITRRFDASRQGRLTAEQAAQKIADCFKSLNWIESSVNERLIFEHLLLNLAETDTIAL